MQNTISQDLVARFAAIVGDQYVLRDPADIDPYVNEPRKNWPGATSLVLRPGSTGEVSAIMKLASETGTAIVPQGGNTGLVGGQMPDAGGTQVVLSLSRLNRIREIDLDSNTVTVEAGVILHNLREQADQVDRLFPLSLGAQGSCQLGGNLSSNAGGVGALAYGVARDLCLGLEVVLPTGEVFEDLRKLKKDNTGYDLKDLFIGAEGTLGVITAAVLKLYPRPKGREVAWVGLADPAMALKLFKTAASLAGTALTSFELISDTVVQFAFSHAANAHKPLAGEHSWHVLMEISSFRSEHDARELMESILGEALEAGHVEDAAMAQSLAQANAFWYLREELPNVQAFEGYSIKHDISVPVVSVPEFIERAAEAVRQLSPGARPACFGHMGDGNLHYNVSEPAGGDPAFKGLYRAMNDAVHRIVRELGGSFSAEHGIGQAKRDELAATEPPVALDLMRRIKAVIDPAGIMNPGKVL